ncbi:MAG: hypothetical protein HZA90_13165 [Verrucomicrobia bacterium]|nr:hypothetical protein [Verrucomicrobiota bacterium]
MERGCIYPCTCSRQDVLRALQAPHQGEEEPVYPGTCRSQSRSSRREEAPFPICNPQSATCNQSAPPHVGCYGLEKGSQALSFESDWRTPNSELGTRNSNLRPNWRFRVPDGEIVSFADSHFGPQHFIAGQDFGDFVVWRHDGVPAYQLAVVVDDAAMGITEVVRGADLLPSTARQILLYRALGLEAPAFFHCPLMTDAAGARLAKRHDALSLRTLREQGRTPERLREMMG